MTALALSARFTGKIAMVTGAASGIGRAVALRLSRDGATLRSAAKDFIVTPDWDFHPTDVLEDADGSVLVVDMGSWFNYGCPTQ